MQQGPKHGPAPAEAEPNGGKGSWIKDANGNWIALGCGNTDTEAAANSARIVLCWNAHDKLVAALDYVCERTYLTAPDGDPAFKSPYDPQVVLDALAAAGVRYGE